MRTKATYLQARYKRLTAGRGPLRALVAVEHSITTAIWHMLTDNTAYQELGGTYFTQRDPGRAGVRGDSAHQAGRDLTGCLIALVTRWPRRSRKCRIVAGQRP
ncbi:hypothetical protein [Streptomyces sp. NPDC088794]|uniref:hypothetical protein n=1 Tax=Streptomyces sp. NPDC088794 TaxID=3365902 RepID=UPI0038223684